MNLTYREYKYWYTETFILKDKKVTCAWANDGLLVMFDAQDIEPILNEHYPHNKKVWWFNDTHDREIAERRDDRIICNPQVYWRHCQ